MIERLGLWLSISKHVDGLWIGTVSEDELVLRRVEEALQLIKAHDRVRYDRLIRDLRRVWIRVLISGNGEYNARIDACELDTGFVLAAPLEVIASLVVHEATHARLIRRGIGYGEDLRARVEAVCVRRELAFAARLPNGKQAREFAQQALPLCTIDSYWTDTAFNERHVNGSVAALRYRGVPNWLVRIALALRALRSWAQRR